MKYAQEKSAEVIEGNFSGLSITNILAGTPLEVRLANMQELKDKPKQEQEKVEANDPSP